MLELINIISMALILVMIPIVYYTFKRKIPYYQGVISSSFCMIFSFVATIFTANKKNGVRVLDTVINEMFKAVNESTGEIIKTITKSGYSAAELKEIENVLADTLSAMEAAYRMLIPAIIILSSLFVCSLVFAALKWVLKLSGKNVSYFPTFADKRFPKGATLVFVVSYFTGIFLKDGMFANIVVNINMIFGTIAAVCGLSYIDFIFKKNLRIGILRFIIYVAAFMILSPVSELLILVLLLVGLMDSLYNFRIRYYISHDNNRKE